MAEEQKTEIVEENLEIDKKDKADKEKEESREFKPDWSNPFMSPYGKPIICSTKIRVASNQRCHSRRSCSKEEAAEKEKERTPRDRK